MLILTAEKFIFHLF